MNKKDQTIKRKIKKLIKKINTHNISIQEYNKNLDLDDVKVTYKLNNEHEYSINHLGLDRALKGICDVKDTNLIELKKRIIAMILALSLSVGIGVETIIVTDNYIEHFQNYESENNMLNAMTFVEYIGLLVINLFLEIIQIISFYSNSIKKDIISSYYLHNNTEYLKLKTNFLKILNEYKSILKKNKRFIESLKTIIKENRPILENDLELLHILDDFNILQENHEQYIDEKALKLHIK